jgi:hypothetical protein
MIKKGNVVRITANGFSIHRERIDGKIGIVLDNGNRYDQYKVSVPNYKILWLLAQNLKVIK